MFQNLVAGTGAIVWLPGASEVISNYRNGYNWFVSYTVGLRGIYMPYVNWLLVSPGTELSPDWRKTFSCTKAIVSPRPYNEVFIEIQTFL